MNKQFFLIIDIENHILGKLELNIDFEKRHEEIIKFFNDLINDDKHEFLLKFGFLFPKNGQKIKDIDAWNKKDFQITKINKDIYDLSIWENEGLLSFNIIELINIENLTTLN
jgi:hypothetical protein